MNFETKIRVMMRELLEPVLKKSQTDREMILALDKIDKKFEERIDLLETTVYN